MNRTPAPRKAARLSPRARTWVVAGLSLVGGYLIATGQQVILRPPLVVGQDAVSTPQSRAARVTLEQAGGPVLRIRPPGGEARTLLILYPGGLVRPQAYEWLGRALAAQGTETVIPAFPLDLAVTAANRADTLIATYGSGKRVVIAGHSLGGAMAAQYAARHEGSVAGLILMAAYPAGNVNLTSQRLPALSLLAEQDRVATPDAVRDGLSRLPPDTTLTVIPGAVHAFFGRYGPQRGDGQPSVNRAQAEQDIVNAVQTFLAGLP
ncbi:alpha/beta fold hydrolase [Deinococcus sedimenti]|uniref:Carboxymethylenebutenolidase-like protein n=1 Tax=Deinococcus sedimenti TaxID=1867090 RepID=A0ABQ2RZT4_9DEIO|nr:alpha/beta fold hydrolase [Deinococcus sedimenti]GGR82768.1 carboxymethylenebutenolidase-like protein [Deinococcus sedimenti]